MTEDPVPGEIAAAWRPERAGRRSPGELRNAIVEPEWRGLRVAAALTEHHVSLWRDGTEVPVPEELSRELLAAFGAVDAVIEGHLTTVALQTGEGGPPALPRVERPPILVPRGLRKSVKDDPYVVARDQEHRDAQVAPVVMEALEEGERHAFVATDLLWLDGQPLHEVPLLERKRHLETVLTPAYLVRLSPYVRQSAIVTLVTWGTQGFTELVHRGANARYTAGEANPNRALARPPEGPMGPSRGPVSGR